MRWLIATVLAALFMPGTANAQTPKTIREEFKVPHADGVQIYVRNKRPDGVHNFAADRIAILMHGATYPSDAFDLALGGKSWMDYLAERGFDVYALDLPGYGRSTRPALMDQPAGDNPPYLRTADAAKALGTVVDFVARRRGVESSESNWMVVGLRHHCVLFSRIPFEGASSCLTCPGLDSDHPFAWSCRRSAWRVSRDHSRSSGEASARRPHARESARVDAQGVVRRLGRCHLCN